MTNSARPSADRTPRQESREAFHAKHGGEQDPTMSRGEMVETVKTIVSVGLMTPAGVPFT